MRKSESTAVHCMGTEIASNAAFNDWGVKRIDNGRFIIYDTTSGEKLDDAQGYGFTTYWNAYNYGYQKYHNKGQCNGKPNIDELNTLI